jgi:hypothetical protein
VAEFEIDFSRLSARAERAESMQSDIWLRTRALADAIPPNVNLGDEVDVTLALWRAGFQSADFEAILSLVIDRARANRRLGL